VTLVARISRSGAPSAASGDLEGSLGPVRPGAQSIDLRIERRLP